MSKKLSPIVLGDVPPLIPTEAWRCVCRAIEPERQLDGRLFELPLAERWQRLTEPLKLAGTVAMRRSAAGAYPALQALAAAAPWAEPLVNDVGRQLSIDLALGRPWVALEPTLIVGAPGIGKTWLADRLARALEVPAAAIELGGISDDRMLAGTARGYTQAQPAWPLVVMARTGVANPFLVLDEIDKAGGSARNGVPHHALLAMLEPSSARAYQDPCLLAPCDLSYDNWIACGNDLAPIPTTLLSRFRVVHLPRPAPEHFDAVLTCIVQEAARKWELPPAMLPDLPQRAVTLLRQRFTRERSVRTLTRDAARLLGAMIADQQPQRH